MTEDVKLNLLDKVEYEFVNWNKPVEYPPMPLGCSGANLPYTNDKIIGVIKRIETTTVQEYLFYNDEDETEGENKYTYTEYFITGYDKPLSASQLKRI